jgi:hypothetical protein
VAENRDRDPFTPSEAVVAARRLQELLAPAARERHKSQAGRGKEGGRGRKKERKEKSDEAATNASSPCRRRSRQGRQARGRAGGAGRQGDLCGAGLAQKHDSLDALASLADDKARSGRGSASSTAPSPRFQRLLTLLPDWIIRR